MNIGKPGNYLFNICSSCWQISSRVSQFNVIALKLKSTILNSLLSVVVKSTKKFGIFFQIIKYISFEVLCQSLVFSYSPPILNEWKVWSSRNMHVVQFSPTFKACLVSLNCPPHSCASTSSLLPQGILYIGQFIASLV